MKGIVNIKHFKKLIVAEIWDVDLQTSDTYTSIELSFTVLMLKHTIKKK